MELQNNQNHKVASETPNTIDRDIPPIICTSICTFLALENDASESENRSKATRKLGGLVMLYLFIIVLEIVGGIKAHSLLIMTDAVHMFADVAGICISLFAVWLSGQKPNSHQSYGFHRAEVLGALLSVQLIWCIVGVLIFEAANRMMHRSSMVDGKIMFIVALFGVVTNLVMVKWLGHSHSHHDSILSHHHHHHHHHHYSHNHSNDEDNTMLLSHSPSITSTVNINIQGAYLHIMSDLIQSTGVMIAGAILWVKPQWVVIDLICTCVFSILVLISTLSMFRNVLVILMERTPREVDIVGLEQGLKHMRGVIQVHDLHVWSISVGKNALSCHVVIQPGASSKVILYDILEYCKRSHKINHVTVQVEQE